MCIRDRVKIEPQSIGVGQYQHDMNQKKLGESLSGVVEDCVNKVGVDLNTASAPLLSYISGISGAIAKNIVAYREEKMCIRDRLICNQQVIGSSPIIGFVPLAGHYRVWTFSSAG